MAAAWREGDDLLLRLYIQPKASRDSIVGLHGEELKVAITAPPIDGKANAHLSKYLAKLCKVAKGSVVVEKRRARTPQTSAYLTAKPDPS